MFENPKEWEGKSTASQNFLQNYWNLKKHYVIICVL